MHEVPLFPLWFTLFLAGWATVGPLAGILIGHILSRGWERRRWLADNRTEEYRKVLAGLNRLNMTLVDHYLTGAANAAEMKQALDESSIALNTSLFIGDFLKESQVAAEILVAVKNLNQGGSFDDYHAAYWKAINTILASAQKSKP